MIDYSSYQSTLNQLDIKESTKIFSDAVEQFAQAVGDMKNSNGSSNPKPLTWGDVLTGGKNQRTSNAQGGQ